MGNIPPCYLWEGDLKPLENLTVRQKENKDIKHTIVMKLHNKYVIMIALTLMPVADDSPTNVIFVQTTSAQK